jgi:hypothetical protein
MKIFYKKIIISIIVLQLFISVNSYCQSQKIIYDLNGNRISKETKGTIPKVTINGVDFACKGNIINLNVISSISGSNFKWNTGSINNTISILVDTTLDLSVMAQTTNGCNNIALIKVKAIDYPKTSIIIGDSFVQKNQSKIYSVNASDSSNYEWTITQNNGVFESGQGTNSVKVFWYNDGLGKLRVVETNKFGCKGEEVSKTINISQVGVTSIPNIQFFKLIPNPSNKDVNIVFLPEVNNGRYSLSITDYLGREIYNQAITTNELILAEGVFNYENGIYFISLKKEDITIDVKKIIRY